jgi:hypothetical protein
MVITYTELKHPFRRDAKDCQTVDQLLRLLQQLKHDQQELRACECMVRTELASRCQGDGKTRRIRGDELEAKVVMPNDHWQQTVLKQCAKTDAELSAVYLRIATYAPNLVEVKKMEGTTGNDRFESFKHLLLSARGPSNSPPTVTLETGKII